MRYGFTTGSCAAAASKAAAYMLLSGRKKTKICITTPKGMDYNPEILDIERMEKSVRCAVQKDGGDDPDVTSGAKIYATVRTIEEEQRCSWEKDGSEAEIIIDGGEGVGRVTKPGLDQPVGNAAINRVPREMIEKEVREVCQLFDYHGTLEVVISVPQGKKIADATFNPRLGILGGISILGTTGIVEPMSEKALLDTIYVELRQHRALGEGIIAVSPGNYGLDYMKKTYQFDLDRSVKCSNYIGATIDMAADLGFSSMLLTGHIGKLVKLSGGMMNTHSKEGDCRMELIASAAIKEKTDIDSIRQILECVTTEEAVRILEDANTRECVMEGLMKKIKFYLNKRAGNNMQIECIMYSNDFGELARTEGAIELLQQLRNG